MPTAFQLTPAQARKLGIDTGSTRESKPRIRRSTAEKLVQSRTLHMEELIEQILPFCIGHGWKIGLCRRPSDDPHSVDYPSVSDSKATPNCIVAWRECAQYAMPRTVHVMWLWELQDDKVTL